MYVLCIKSQFFVNDLPCLQSHSKRTKQTPAKKALDFGEERTVQASGDVMVGQLSI